MALLVHINVARLEDCYADFPPLAAALKTLRAMKRDGFLVFGYGGRGKPALIVPTDRGRLAFAKYVRNLRTPPRLIPTRYSHVQWKGMDVPHETIGYRKK